MRRFIHTMTQLALIFVALLAALAAVIMSPLLGGLFIILGLAAWRALPKRYTSLVRPERLWLPLFILSIIVACWASSSHSAGIGALFFILIAATALMGALAFPHKPSTPPASRRKRPTTNDIPPIEESGLSQGLPKVNLTSATAEEILEAIPAWEKYLFTEASGKNDPSFGAAPYPFTRLASMYRRLGKIYLKNDDLPHAWEAYRRLYSIAVWYYRIFDIPQKEGDAYGILMGRLLSRSRDLYRFVYTPDKDDFIRELDPIKASDITALRKLYSQLAPPPTPPKERPRSRHKAEIEAYEHYAAQGYLGYFAENGLWSSMMLLLFWDEIYNIVPAPIKRKLFGPLPNDHQDLPPDFFQPDFFYHRKKHIRKRLRELAKANLAATLETIHKQKDTQIYIYRPRIYDPAYTNDITPLRKAAEHIPNSALLAIMERLITNFKENRSGFPDFFLISPEGEPLFVEAKGAKETIKPNQEATLSFLQSHGANIQIYRLGIGPVNFEKA